MKKKTKPLVRKKTRKNPHLAKPKAGTKHHINIPALSEKLLDTLFADEHKSDVWPVWVTADKRHIPVDEMTTDHLLNTLAHINKRQRMLREGIQRLENYRVAMEKMLEYRDVWVRPGESPIAPIRNEYGNRYRVDDEDPAVFPYVD
jgi:hypothetical protein